MQWFIENGFLPNPNGIFVYTNGVFEDGQSVVSGSNNSNFGVTVTTLVNALEIALKKSTSSNVSAFGNAIFDIPISLNNYNKLVIEYDVISIAYPSGGSIGFLLTTDRTKPSYDNCSGHATTGGGIIARNDVTSYSLNRNVTGSGLKFEIDISNMSGNYYFAVFHASFNGLAHEDKMRINKIYLS